MYLNKVGRQAEFIRAYGYNAFRYSFDSVYSDADKFEDRDLVFVVEDFQGWKLPHIED